MDEFVVTKLTEWDSPAALIDRFRDNGVDEEVFNALNDEMIKDLIPQIGIRYKFTNKYKSYIASIISNSAIVIEDFADIISDVLSETTTESVASTSSIIVPEVPQQCVKKNVVKDLLERDPQGKEIMSCLKNCKKLERAKLAALLVDKQLENDPDTRITSSQFQTWAQDIVDTFPGERPETYYVPYTRNEKGPSSARGILWDRYLNKRRVLRKIGILTSRNSNTASGATYSKESEDTEALAWLRNNIEPFDSVLIKWKETHNERLNIDGHLGISAYFELYKCLKLPNGYILIDVDFQYLHPNESNNLLLQWPKVARQIISIAKERPENDIKDLLTLHAALLEEGCVGIYEELLTTSSGRL